MYLRDELDQRIADCLNQLDRFWLFDPVVEAADDLEGIDEDFLTTGEIDLWAAGLIFAISRHNGLSGREFELGISLEDIGNFYSLDHQLVVIQADDLRHTLDLDTNAHFYRDFNFPSIHEDSDESDEEDDLWIGAVAIFKYRMKIGQKRLKEFEEVIEQALGFCNEDEDEDDYLQVLSVNARGQLLEIELEGFEGDIDFFCYQLEEEGLDLAELRYEEDDLNRYTPSEHYSLSMEQYESFNLGNQEFESIEEVEAALDDLIDKRFDDLKAKEPLSPEAEASLAVIKAYHLPRSESIAEVDRILQLYPSCIEAHICLAGWFPEPKGRIKMLKDAMALGAQSMDLEEITRNGNWWVDYRTRPYLRAMHLLAEEYLATGNDLAAYEVLWSLIDLDEADHLLNRVMLLEASILRKNWIEAGKVFTRYPHDDNLSFVYGKAIYLFHTLGKKGKTKRAIIDAYHRNKYPLRMIVGIEEYPDYQPFFTPGDKTEATEVIDFLLACFTNENKLVKYILEVLLKNEEWEREEEVFDISKDYFIPSAKIIPLDRRSDN